VLLAPSLRAVIRARGETLSNVCRSLLSLGLLAVGPAIGLIALISDRLYEFDLGVAELSLGALTVIPVFWYLPVIYGLYGAGKERTVLAINLAGAVVNLALALALLPVFVIAGALLANGIAQFTMLVAYARKLRVAGGWRAAPVPRMSNSA
jgi:O-antigen/teichoic acid export membrane protein